MRKNSKILEKENYLAVIRNSVGSKLFNNFYVEGSGQPKDLLDDGYNSCAYYVSSILKMFNLIKDIHLNFEDLVIESLREKKFSHSSINDTANELGNVSRTLISENYRGVFFKTYFDNNYDLERSVNLIAASDDEQVIERVKAKLERFLFNIENDTKPYGGKEFEFVKSKFSSKYKNLPQKFHFYLDEIIKRYLK